MISTLVVLLIGFSVVSLALLLPAYLFFFDQVQKTWQGRIACTALSFGLAALQLAHLQHVWAEVELLDHRGYLVLLFLVPTSFYFFSRDILLPGARLSTSSALHLVPPVAALWLPAAYVVPAAFAIGAGYSLWLAHVVRGMRRHVARFRFEMFFFGLFALIALAVLILVLALPWIGASGFYRAYAGAIGMGVVLVTAALLIYPDILGDISDAARLTYANSTLKGVDVEGRLAQLDHLLTHEKLHRNEDISLSTLAEAMSLSAHQLSELINSRFGVGFSRFIRERRVTEARTMLAEDRRSSVLSIGMMCGFGSQSAFYAAFREATGLSPAAFRKQRTGLDTPE